MSDNETAFCEIEICKQNFNGVCIANHMWECPKNNDVSIFQRPELLKKVKANER